MAWRFRERSGGFRRRYTVNDLVFQYVPEYWRIESSQYWHMLLIIMKFFIFIFFILVVQFCFSQKIDWEKTKNWKLYDIHDDNAFRYSLDTLRNFKSLKLDEIAMHDFLKEAVSWPEEKKSLWMGLYVTTCEIQNGETR